MPAITFARLLLSAIRLAAARLGAGVCAHVSAYAAGPGACLPDGPPLEAAPRPGPRSAPRPAPGRAPRIATAAARLPQAVSAPVASVRDARRTSGPAIPARAAPDRPPIADTDPLHPLRDGAGQGPRARRIAGCLLGGAVGDAFGYEIEFESLEAIVARFGARGLRQPVLRQGRLQVSDDTQMTLFTLEGLLRAPHPVGLGAATVAQVRLAYLDWLHTQRGRRAGVAGHPPPAAGWLATRPALQARRAPGSTCLQAAASGAVGSVDAPINDSKGCGAVMRAAPVGFLAVPDATRLRLGSAVGALTHGHPDGWLPSGLMAVLTGRLLDGESLPDALAFVLSGTLVGLPAGARTPALLERARELAVRQPRDPQGAIRQLGLGWTGDEALAIAVYAALTGADFADTMARAANHDGDSDSTASLAGQLLGAWKGLDAVPARWAAALDVLDETLLLAREAQRVFG